MLVESIFLLLELCQFENGTDRTHNELWNYDPQNGVKEANAEIKALIKDLVLAMASRGYIPVVNNVVYNLNDPLKLYTK